MKSKYIYIISFIMLIAAFTGISTFQGCSASKKIKAWETDTIADTVHTWQTRQGVQLQLLAWQGKAHNHPLMAVWLEDTNGNFLETIYIAESIGKGFFDYGQKDKGKWQPGPILRPAALPYWMHKACVNDIDKVQLPTQSNPVPDAITGPTPESSFAIDTKIKSYNHPVMVLVEINQTWDWNEHWHNNKYPNDSAYKTSCQPALVYAAKVQFDLNGTYQLELIGHSHYSGKTGELFKDTSTITTAKNIFRRMEVWIRP